jgi:hypothetical protein
MSFWKLEIAAAQQQYDSLLMYQCFNSTVSVVISLEPEKVVVFGG